MRTAKIARKTNETDIAVSVNLDGTGKHQIATGIGFLDHMLDQLAKHSLIDITVKAKGDLHIDFHHTAEDVGIALGEAVKQALGDKKGIRRYAAADLPMDGSLTRAAVDVSGRPYCVHTGEPEGQEYVAIGGTGATYMGSLTRHVFETISFHAHLALHVRVLGGRDPHHVVEAQYKAFARAFRDAVAIDPRETGVPSTKGTL